VGRIGLDRLEADFEKEVQHEYIPGGRTYHMPGRIALQ
jgi:hypothetical protein